MSAPYDTEIPDIFYDMAWDEFNAGDFDDEINDMVQDHGFDATKIALATCYPMDGTGGGSRARFIGAEIDFKSHIDVIIERRAGEHMRDNS